MCPHKQTNSAWYILLIKKNIMLFPVFGHILLFYLFVSWYWTKWRSTRWKNIWLFEPLKNYVSHKIYLNPLPYAKSQNSNLGGGWILIMIHEISLHNILPLKKQIVDTYCDFLFYSLNAYHGVNLPYKKNFSVII